MKRTKSLPSSFSDHFTLILKYGSFFYSTKMIFYIYKIISILIPFSFFLVSLRRNSVWASERNEIYGYWVSGVIIIATERHASVYLKLNSIYPMQSNRSGKFSFSIVSCGRDRKCHREKKKRIEIRTLSFARYVHEFFEEIAFDQWDIWQIFKEWCSCGF